MKNVNFAKTNASVLLDLVRGISAFIVVLEHWRNLFFVDYSQIGSHRSLFAIPYLLTSAGHQAVVIFFILSGYLISGSVFRMFDRGIWSWSKYLTHRLVRLWIVLIPGLLLCLLWDRLGIVSGHAPSLYRGLVPNHMVTDVSQHLGFPTLLGNLFFMQTIRTPIFGSDGALWSLANEFWYYILFPLGLHCLRKQATTSTRVICVFLLLAVSGFVGWPILSLFPIWLAGTLLCVVPTRPFAGRVRLIAAVLYAPLIFFFARQTVVRLSDLASDYLLAIATFCFLWIMLSAREEAKTSVGVSGSRTLSRFSYTLYVVHTPLLVFLTALLAGDKRWEPTLQHGLVAGACLVGTMAYAYLVAYLTEFRTEALRQRMEQQLQLNPKRISAVGA